VKDKGGFPGGDKLFSIKLSPREPTLHAIRRANARDAEAVARLHRLVRRASLPFLPDLYTPDEDLQFFRGTVFAQCEVWVAGGDAIDGFIAFRAGWIDHLYVRPECQREGIGTALLAQAMLTYPLLRLWTFQRNESAVSFYRARGFREIERTDGSRNEEREPDVLMEWTRT
jgi:putative acetyltransferase